MVHHSAFARSHAMPASRHNLAFVFRRHISLSFTNSLTSGNRRNRGPDRDVSTIKGRATAEGTRSYREKHRDLAGGWIPKKDWHVSRFGFGCHRISVSSSNPDKSENEAALRVALRGGVNIIDTGSWFENGNSERLVGDILKELTGSGELERQEVVVISKSGPIPPSLLSSLPSGIPYVEIPNSQVHWSAHPQFLEHYITYSLSRMGLDHIDIWGIDGFDRALASPQMSPTQLSDLLRSAFQHLDKEVERGRIGGYLWSSNSLSAPGGAAGFGWGLDKIVSLVERPENLLAIEYPFNLFESDVARSSHPTTTLARQYDLCQITNRPLNVIAGGAVRTLSDGALDAESWVEGWTTEAVEDPEYLSRQLAELFDRGTKLEEEFRHFVDEAETPPPSPFPSFVWSQAMLDHAPRLAPNLLATRHFLSGTLGPQVREDLDDAVNLAKNWGGEECKKALEWIDAYRQLMTVDIPPLLISLSQSVTKASNRELDSLLRPLVPPIKRPSMPGLASTALKLTAAVEPGDPAFWDSFNRDSSGQGFESGVEAPARQPAAPLGFELPYRRDGSKTEFGFEQATVTLVGMRRPAYVRHILKISSELGSEETRIQPGEWADVAYRHGLLDG